jgi:hypothetical protein
MNVLPWVLLALVGLGELRKQQLSAPAHRTVSKRNSPGLFAEGTPATETNPHTAGIAVSLWTSVLHSPHISRAALASHYWVKHFDHWMFNTFDPVDPHLQGFLTQMPYVVPEVEKKVDNQDGRLGQTEALHAKWPDSKWYFLGDADTMVVTENLVCTTKSLDPNTPVLKVHQNVLSLRRVVNEVG